MSALTPDASAILALVSVYGCIQYRRNGITNQPIHPLILPIHGIYCN
jgi:hypothetical protein